jgi:hypothetical protein
MWQSRRPYGLLRRDARAMTGTLRYAPSFVNVRQSVLGLNGDMEFTPSPMNEIGALVVPPASFAFFCGRDDKRSIHIGDIFKGMP